MMREVKEEVGIDVSEKDLEKMGEIEFYFPEQNGWDVFVHVFISRKWKGEARESDEMRPEWLIFALQKLCIMFYFA